MTVGALLISTLKLIGAVSATSPASPDEMQDSLARLQDMIDSWMAERLSIFVVKRSVYSLVSGQQEYTIGPGGDFDQPRPVWIQDAGIISNTNPLQPLELPMTLLSDDDYASVSIKNVATSLAWFLYYNYDFDTNGRGKLWFWPIPNVSTLEVALYVPTPLTQVSTLTQILHFPPGYAEAVRFNLAVRLCPEFGKQLDPVVGGLAVESFARIERANKRLQRLGVDAALLGASGGWNYLTGMSTGGSSPGGN